MSDPLVPEKPKLTLIDASGFIFRAYHAIQHLSTSKGVPTNAVYGFTRMLLKAMKDFSPTHLGLAFDKESRTARQAIDPTYKANREGPPPDLIPQFELIRRVVAALNVPVIEFAGWEADDVIGTLTKQARAKGYQVLVITGDKDFIQIVEDDVRLYDPMQDKHTGPKEVEERLSIQPGQMRDYLALLGDAIDNVAKVPGIGPKTAVELIHQFGSVESLLERLAEVKKSKIRETLMTHQEQLRRAKQLVSFNCELPISLDWEGLARRPVNDQQARNLFSELEFYRLLQEIPAESAHLPGWGAAPPPTELSVKTEVLTDEASLSAVAQAAAETKALSVVPAFEGLPYAADLVGLGLGLTDGRTFYLPLRHHYMGVPAQLPLQTVRQVLGPVLADASVKKAGHDLKSATLVLASAGMPLSGAENDAELLSYLLNPSRKEHALADLSRERLSQELPAELAGKKNAPLHEAPVEVAATRYGACADAARRLPAILWKELEDVGLAKLARELELPLLPVLAEMERAGVKVDAAALAKISEKVAAECRVKLTEIQRMAGHEFNVNSNTQLATVLYDELKLPVLKRGKTGPSTDQEVLEKLGQQHPLPKQIIEYRTLSKLKSTYLDTLPLLVAKDGRLHTSFHQASTATGRLSSSEPNLQNIPIRTEVGKEIRAAFVAEPGHQLISADYSQIELRILAHVAEDPALIEAFLRDEDLHTRTASEVFGVPLTEVTGNQRRAAKAVNFGIAYGLSPHGLSTRLDIPVDEAKTIIDRYFERFAGIRRYLGDTVEKARKTGFVETLFGRRRYMPDLHSKNRNAAMAAERAAINMPIQGTAADLMKLAMLAIQARLKQVGPGTRLLLQVHDELLFEAPDAEVAAVMALAREEMGKVATFKVPLKVDVGAGPRWTDAH